MNLFLTTLVFRKWRVKIIVGKNENEILQRKIVLENDSDTLLFS